MEGHASGEVLRFPSAGSTPSSAPHLRPPVAAASHTPGPALHLGGTPPAGGREGDSHGLEFTRTAVLQFCAT